MFGCWLWTPQILGCFPGPCPLIAPLLCVLRGKHRDQEQPNSPSLAPFSACFGSSEGHHDLLLSQLLPVHLHGPRASQEVPRGFEDVTNMRKKEFISIGFTQWQLQNWEWSPHHRWMWDQLGSGFLGQNECGVSTPNSRMVWTGKA